MASYSGLVVRLQQTMTHHDRTRRTRSFDILAVHGLGGYSTMSWTSYGDREQSETWLDDALVTKFDQSRIITFGYELDSQSITVTDICNLALKLLNSLMEKREETNTTDRDLVFIGHDIGGLIIKKALTIAVANGFPIVASTASLDLQSVPDQTVLEPSESEKGPDPMSHDLKAHPAGIPNHYQECPLIVRIIQVFLATPHRTLDDPSWVNLACSLLVTSGSHNPRTPLSESAKTLAATMYQINREFREISRIFQITSVYEEDHIGPPSPVIDSYSATYGTANEERRCLQKTHYELSKLSEDVQEEEELLKLISEQATGSTKFPVKYFQFLQKLRSLSAGPKDTPQTAAQGYFQWLDQHSIYKSWKSDPNKALWIQIKDEYGKDRLISYIISDFTSQKHCTLIENQVPDQRQTEVMYFSFDTEDETQRTTFTMFATLSYQLLCCQPDLFSHVERISDIFMSADLTNERSKVRVDRLWALFRTLISCPEHASRMCILGSVDKCDPSGDSFLEDYILLCQSLTSAPKLVITSSSRSGMPDNVPEDSIIHIDSMTEYRADIKKLVKHGVRQLIKKRPAFTNFSNRIETLLDGPDMNLDTTTPTLELLYRIQAPSTARGIEQILAPLSGQLEEVYEKMMSINQESSSVWGQQVLSWMMHVIRPLTVPEMSLALALRADDDGASFDNIRFNIAEDLTLDLERAFGGLIHVRNGQVQFIHNTFLEYLHRKHKGECPAGCLLCVDYHPIIARLCLSYILMADNEHTVNELIGEEVRESTTNSEALLTLSNPHHGSLIAYAVEYWPVHYRKATSNSRKQNKCSFNKFFDNQKLIDTWANQFWLHQNPLIRQSSDTKSSLSIAAEVGCAELVSKLLDPSRLGMAVGSDSNALAVAIEKGYVELVEEALKRATHQHALHIAASHGQVELFPILKERLGSTVKGSEYTPLHNASESGNAGVVEEILQGHANDALHAAKLANAIGGLGETPLHEASRFGHVNVINILLQHADPNIANSEWKTPLHLACLWQQPGAVEALLREQRIRPDAVDQNKRTALHFAASSGRIDIVKMILSFYSDKMVKAEALQMQDDEGRTPLHLAALGGYEKVIREILKETSPSPGSAGLTDNVGSTALHLGIQANNLNIVCELLEFSPDQINSPDISQNIPIHLAASKGYTMIAKRLCEEHIERRASLDVFNNKSLTPLHLACEKGYADIVEVLLEHHAEAEITGPNGETPLLVVCRKGYDDIAPLLLDSLADSMGIDNHGYSPLHLAARNGNKSLVDLLLGYDVNVDLEDGDGRVPMHLAAGHGHREIVHLLLIRGADPTISDFSGRSLLHYACEGGNRYLVKFLIQHILGADALGNPDKTNQMPLHAASEAGKHDIVELLLTESVDPNPSDNMNQTPLDLATDRGVIALLLDKIPKENLNKEKRGRMLLSSAEQGHIEVVEILLSWDVDPNIMNDEQQTPLHLAALRGHDNVVNLLLSQPTIEPDKPDNNCHTPLSYAAQHGNVAIVQSILNSKLKVDPDSQDNLGKTPLFLSAEEGHVKVVEEILNNDIVVIDRKDQDGVTPLWLAATNGHHKVVKALLSRGADPNATDTEGRTPLHRAAERGWPEVAITILELDTFNNGNAQDFSGRTALYLAAYYGRTETLSILLSRGLDTKITGPIGWRPLHAAYGCLPVVRLILKHTRNEDVDFGDKNGETALFLSIDRGWETVAKELLQNGADPLKAANNGTTPLHQAARRKGVTFFPFVLKNVDADKDVNIKNDYGETPFFLALDSQNIDAVRALLQRDNFSVCAFDNDGVRTIERVIETSNTDMLMLLIKDNRENLLPADMSEQEANKLVLKAFKTGDKEICNVVLGSLSNANARTNEIFDLVAAEQPGLAGLLLNHGADPSKADKHGWSLDWIRFVYGSSQGDAVNTKNDTPPAVDFKQPSSWSPEDKDDSIELVMGGGIGLGVKRKGVKAPNFRWYRRSQHSGSTGCVRANHPIPPDREFYFEVKITNETAANLLPRSYVSIGFSRQDSALNQLPGYRNTTSWGYHGDSGRLYPASVPGIYCEEFGVADVVGCCINPIRGTAFFTKNGKRQAGTIQWDGGRVFPLVCIKGDAEVQTYFPAQNHSFLYRLDAEESLGSPGR